MKATKKSGMLFFMTFTLFTSGVQTTFMPAR
jgi:hypothetical protein